jgi:hypothetical protein
VIPDAVSHAPTSGSGCGAPRAAATRHAAATAADISGASSTGHATTGPILNTTASYSISAWVNMTNLPTHNATIAAQSGTTASAFYLGHLDKKTVDITERTGR